MTTFNESNLYGLIYTMCKGMCGNANLKIRERRPQMVYFTYMYDCLNMAYLSVSMANTLKIGHPGKEKLIDDAKTKAQALLIQELLDQDAATKKMAEYDENAVHDYDGRSAKDSEHLDKYDHTVVEEVICFPGAYEESMITDTCGEILRELATEMDEAIAGIVVE